CVTSSTGLPSDLALAAITARIRGPSTAPGRIALARMPSGPNSMASDLVKPTTAHLDAEYGVRPGKPRWPAADDRLMMLGPRPLHSRGTASRVHRNWLVMLTASVRSQSALASVSTGP